MAVGRCGYQGSSGVSLMRYDESSDPGVWELCGGVLDMPQPSITASTGQCDDFDSAADGYAEYFKTGRFEVPELSLLIGMIPGNPIQQKLYADTRRVGTDAGGDELVKFRIVIPTATVTTLEFGALVVSFGWNFTRPSADDNKITHPISLRPSGELSQVIA